MNVKIILGAVGLVAALAIGAPAFAADDGAMKAPKHHATHHKKVHHHPMHKAAADKPMHKMHHGKGHHMHGGMGVDAKERAETAKLNQEQLMHPGQ
jgi:hypothetical protein